MMLLPLGDTLMNCLQNLTSRIAGIDNEQMTNRVMGTTAMLGFGLGAIKEQFKTPSMSSGHTDNNSNNFNGGFKGLVNRAKSVINPSLNLSDEKDYDGNINPIRNVVTKTNNNVTSPISNVSSKTDMKNDSYNPKSMANKVAKAGFTAVKTYVDIGAKMAEGNFDKPNYKGYSNKKTSKTNTFQNTQYINNMSNNKLNEIGDNDEHKK